MPNARARPRWVGRFDCSFDVADAPRRCARFWEARFRSHRSPGNRPPRTPSPPRPCRRTSCSVRRAEPPSSPSSFSEGSMNSGSSPGRGRYQELLAPAAGLSLDVQVVCAHCGKPARTDSSASFLPRSLRSARRRHCRCARGSHRHSAGSGGFRHGHRRPAAHPARARPMAASTAAQFWSMPRCARRCPSTWRWAERMQRAAGLHRRLSAKPTGGIARPFGRPFRGRSWPMSR